MSTNTNCPWVKIDDEVEMTLASVPGKTFKGSLAYIYPYAGSQDANHQGALGV